MELSIEKWHLDEDSRSLLRFATSQAVAWHLRRTLGSTELTFILLARPEGASSDPIPSTQELIALKMIGDVNLFLPNGVEEDVECEIMIAGAFPSMCQYSPCVRLGSCVKFCSLRLLEKEYRGRGIAAEALSLMYTSETAPFHIAERLTPHPSIQAQLRHIPYRTPPAAIHDPTTHPPAHVPLPRPHRGHQHRLYQALRVARVRYGQACAGV